MGKARSPVWWSTIGLLMTSCVLDAGDLSTDDSTSDQAEGLSGAAWQADPPAVGIAKVYGTFAEGSAVVWRSWYSAYGQGAHLLTARHVVNEADALRPSKVIVRMGSYTAKGAAISPYPYWSAMPWLNVDLTVIRVDRALPVGGNWNFSRTLSTSDYSQQYGRPLACYGYGPTTTLRWAWLRGGYYQHYGFPSASVPNHSLVLESYAEPQWRAQLEPSDSGGPCFDSSGQMAAIVYKRVPGNGGIAVAMDYEIRSWLNANAP